MKSFFSILILLSLKLSAGTYFVITYNKHKDLALEAKSNFIKTHQFPEEIIKLMKQEDACKQNIIAVVQLCVTDNRDIQYVKKESEAIRFAFQSFVE